MSIDRKCLEMRLTSLEQAVMFLSEGLEANFPNMPGVSSIRSGMSEAWNDIEKYKAEEADRRRVDLRKGSKLITWRDLALLCRLYLPELAKVSEYVQVLKSTAPYSYGDTVYEVTLSERIFDPKNLGLYPNWPHTNTVKLIVSIGTGVRIDVAENLSMDFESVTYRVPYDASIVPLLEDRIIDWFRNKVDVVDCPKEWIPVGHDEAFEELTDKLNALAGQLATKPQEEREGACHLTLERRDRDVVKRSEVSIFYNHAQRIIKLQEILDSHVHEKSFSMEMDVAESSEVDVTVLNKDEFLALPLYRRMAIVAAVRWLATIDTYAERYTAPSGTISTVKLVPVKLPESETKPDEE